MKNQHIASLMQKDMSRKEFLAIIGLGIGSILGFGHIIHLFTGKSWRSVTKAPQSYTTSSYGR